MSPELWSALALSVRVAVLATAVNAAVGIPLAWLLARRRFRGKSLVDLAVTLPLVLPPTVTGYYLIVVLGRRGWLGAPLHALTGWALERTDTDPPTTPFVNVIKSDTLVYFHRPR